MNLTLSSQTYFAGQFVVSDDTGHHAIGDNIKVTLKGEPYKCDTIVVKGKEIPVFTFPLTVEFSSMAEPFDADLKITMGRVCKHWLDYLEVGKTSVILVDKYEYLEHIWYTPIIDGWNI